MVRWTLSTISALCITAVVALYPGCDVPFSPKGEYSEKIVVYSVLDASKGTQFARVYLTYNVSGVNPLENTTDTQVPGATVTVYDPAKNAYVYRDTLLQRDTTDRYSSEVAAYYTNLLTPVSGKQYQLVINVPELGVVTSQVTVPDPFIIYVDLSDSLLCDCIKVSLYGGAGAKGQLTRFFVEVAVVDNAGNTTVVRQEVPSSVSMAEDGTIVPIYPQPDRAGGIEFQHAALSYIYRNIQAQYPGSSLEVRKYVFITYSLESNLYDYYYIVRGFGDPFSVRMDLPDFSNIDNGLGVFGAIAVDSLTIPFAR